MSLQEIYQQFIDGMQATTWLEYIAVFSGIVSVWFSRKENILVYPTGLVNTIFYIYLSIKGSLFGEASVNFYYTVMSIYGWILWARRDTQKQPIIHITYSNKRWWYYQLAFFAAFYIVIFTLLTYLKKDFAPEAIPWGDAFASATAFTGMWLMTKKKVESWYWWIATNIASIPLYFTKHYVFTSVYYLILLVMAVFGLLEWMRRAKNQMEPKVLAVANENPTPFNVHFYYPQEIRMGSPFNACERVELIGTDKIKLPEGSWQDLCAWSDDNQILVMVKWDIATDNIPFFRFYIINTITGIAMETERIQGCLQSLFIYNHKIKFRKLNYSLVENDYSYEDGEYNLDKI